MRLLFVEDDPRSIAQVKKKVGDDHPDIECIVKGFAEVDELIRDDPPDMVSLDLLEGGLSGEPEIAGQGVYDLIWKERFCPIIVYSAQPDAGDEYRPDHPFVRHIKKGRGSPQRFSTAVSEFRVHVDAIKEAEAGILKEYSFALREVAPYAFKAFPNNSEKRKDAILRCGRRRLAALMDDLSRHGQLLETWEQYICPPVCGDIQLGDIIRKADAAEDDPCSFYLVLTPSCDMATSENRSPKVESILVASCCHIKDGLDHTSIVGMTSKKLKERLPRMVLTPGYFETIIPIPGLVGHFPTMSADIRKLEFIPIQNIGTADTKYIRAASIDSPFRELISWAYMQTACRPGLPDRCLDSWRDEIVNLCKDRNDNKAT